MSKLKHKVIGVLIMIFGLPAFLAFAILMVVGMARTTAESDAHKEAQGIERAGPVMLSVVGAKFDIQTEPSQDRLHYRTNVSDVFEMNGRDQLVISELRYIPCMASAKLLEFFDVVVNGKYATEPGLQNLCKRDRTFRSVRSGQNTLVISVTQTEP